ncbi:hypothetical protein WJX79_001692 [Trebouxia sp. C0005]
MGQKLGRDVSSHSKKESQTPAGNPLPHLIHAELSAAQLGAGRLIVVGDVHGCPDELKILLRKCQFQQGSDVLAFNGDIINKGPKSVQAIDLIQSLGGIVVRGNQDDKALAQYVQWQSGEPLEEKSKWLEELGAERAEWLKQLPFSLSVPCLKLLVVHAGLIPGIPLKEQSLKTLTELRTLPANAFLPDGIADSDSSEPKLDETERLRSAWAPSTKLAVRTFSSAPAAAEIPDSWRNPAAVLHGIDDIRFEDVPLPDKVADGHVRVQMRAVGICGSDVHYYKKGRVGHFVVNAPMVLGHESAGDIIECGPGVTSRQVGDRVALEPGVPCWSNRMSRQGRYNLDPDVKFFATPPVHGSLARYVDHPADFCFKMPDSLSYEQGAMVEPLSNAVHACRRGGVGPGKKVAILGAGPIGLMVLAAAKAFSASSVAITDIRPDNLPVAKQLGAKHALDQSKAMSANDTVEALKAVFAEGPDIVIDCVGFESTITTALDAVAPGGRIVLVGLGAEKCCVPTMQTVFKEIDFMGSFRYTNTYPTCLDLLEEKKIDCEPLITHRFGFSEKDIITGFETAAAAGKTGAIKVMFNW